MTIKRMMAGLMAGILMMGTFSTTCFAAAADSGSTEKKPEVISENATTTPDVAGTEETEEEKLPYDVSVDEDGNYTFSFGDWEWSTEGHGNGWNRCDGQQQGQKLSEPSLRFRHGI